MSKEKIFLTNGSNCIIPKFGKYINQPKKNNFLFSVYPNDEEESSRTNNKKIENLENSEESSDNSQKERSYKNKFLYKKRRRNNQLKNIKHDYNNSISQTKAVKQRKEEKLISSNSLSEISDCYKILQEEISKHSFVEVANIIIKIINDIKESSQDNNELFEKIKNAISRIKNQESISLILLDILSKKILLKNEIQNNSNKNEEDINTEENGEVCKEKRKKKDNYIFVNSIEEIPDKKYSFGKHYYQHNNKLYCFKPKKLQSVQAHTFFCMNKNCSAKCVIRCLTSDVKFFGSHNHNDGISEISFYKKFPYLKNINWVHIQIIKGIENNMLIIRE